MLLMWGVCVVILIWQRDLGTATIFFVIFMAMLYLASGQWLLLVGGGALLAVAAAVAYRMFDVVALRIDIWLNPWPEAEGRSFQIVQSLMAVSAGGILGQGIGQGSPNFIPVVHTDFVFAAIAEEWGLIGVSGLLLILALIVTRALRIALGSQHRPFAAFLAAGLGIMLATQSLLIMGGTLRLWPLTGVTLPFVSYGGSSLLTSFVAIGLLLVLSESEGV
jgi:cell division protein FtsW